MITIDQIKLRLADIAQRNAGVRERCHNKDGVKIFIALPFVASLGFNLMPSEVEPSAHVNGCALDLLVKVKGEPAIGVMCYEPGSDWGDAAARAADLFSANPMVPSLLATDGQRFAFFFNATSSGVRCAEPDIEFELSAFLGEPPTDLVNSLQMLSRSHFSAAELRRVAIRRHVVKRTREFFAREISAPSPEFCAFILHKMGCANVQYGGNLELSEFIRTAFVDALVAPIRDRLSNPPAPQWPAANVTPLRAAAPG